MAGPVLDSLADSLVPAAMEAKTQTDKAKVTGVNRFSSVFRNDWEGNRYNFCCTSSKDKSLKKKPTGGKKWHNDLALLRSYITTHFVRGHPHTETLGLLSLTQVSTLFQGKSKSKSRSKVSKVPAA